MTEFEKIFKPCTKKELEKRKKLCPPSFNSFFQSWQRQLEIEMSPLEIRRICNTRSSIEAQYREIATLELITKMRLELEQKMIEPTLVFNCKFIETGRS